MVSGLSTAYDYLNVWCTYCDVIRRSITDWSNPDSTAVAKLRETFERGIHHLLQRMCSFTVGVFLVLVDRV